MDDDGEPLSEEQRENIRLAIDMYARGEGLPKWDGLVYIQDGRVVGANEVQSEREYWFEVSTAVWYLGLGRWGVGLMADGFDRELCRVRLFEGGLSTYCVRRGRM